MRIHLFFRQLLKCSDELLRILLDKRGDTPLKISFTNLLIISSGVLLPHLIFLTSPDYNNAWETIKLFNDCRFEHYLWNVLPTITKLFLIDFSVWVLRGFVLSSGAGIFLNVFFQMDFTLIWDFFFDAKEVKLTKPDFKDLFFVE